MRIRSFIIAYALLLVVLLFADRRPSRVTQDRYSHVVDLTQSLTGSVQESAARSETRIIAPDSLIPGTWTAGQIPPERLIAPLVVMDLNVAPPGAPAPAQYEQISLDDIAAWESRHGAIPQGALVAIRGDASKAGRRANLPITADAAQFLMDARYTLGFAIENAADLGSDRPLARQIALHGNYVVEDAARLSTIPATGSLIIVAPAREKNGGVPPVRVLAMVR